MQTNKKSDSSPSICSQFLELSTANSIPLTVRPLKPSDRLALLFPLSTAQAPWPLGPFPKEIVIHGGGDGGAEAVIASYLP
jgi:hypothetical protein